MRNLDESGAELLDQPRLADPGLADDERELAFASTRSLPTAGEVFELPHRARRGESATRAAASSPLARQFDRALPGPAGP